MIELKLADGYAAIYSGEEDRFERYVGEKDVEGVRSKIRSFMPQKIELIGGIDTVFSVWVDKTKITEEALQAFISEFSVFPNLEIKKVQAAIHFAPGREEEYRVPCVEENVDCWTYVSLEYQISCSNFILVREPDEDELEELGCEDYEDWLSDYINEFVTYHYDALPVYLAFRKRFSDLIFFEY